MKVYRLDPIARGDPSWQYSIEKDSVWTCAASPNDARKLVQSCCGARHSAQVTLARCGRDIMGLGAIREPYSRRHRGQGRRQYCWRIRCRGRAMSLVGAQMVGAEVTELIQGYVMAMNIETTEEELMRTVFPPSHALGSDARSRARCLWTALNF